MSAVERGDADSGRLDAPGPSLLDELMTSSQVAALLQMRLSTAESYARRGLLPSMKVGRHRRFIRSDVERALTALVDGHERVSRERDGRASPDKFGRDPQPK
jgi:excisionase family DNA binding protein